MYSILNAKLPMSGGEIARIGKSCEKYIKSMQMITQVIPFNKIFSPLCGGNQKLASVMTTINVAGVQATALYIGDTLRKVKLKA